MKKKKKNSVAYLELRTGAFGVLTFTGLAVMAYASFGILLSGLISMNSSAPRGDLIITIIALSVAVILLLRFAWLNGKMLWGEWKNRLHSDKLAKSQNASFAHLSDEASEIESDLGETEEQFKSQKM